MPNCVDLWSDLKSLQTDRSTTLEVTLQEHTLQTHIKISDSGGLMSLLVNSWSWITTYCKKKQTFFPSGAENHVCSMRGMVQDRWKVPFFINTYWYRSALPKRRICFSSLVLLFLGNNIFAFGSRIFCCRAASLGKSKSFTEKKKKAFFN